MSEVVLRAEQLGKRLGRRAVLEHIDLEIRAGENHALLGRNGAGKTTLLRLLAGLSVPSEGRVFVPGVSDRRRARAAIGFVGHECLLYNALSARENLRFCARLYRCGDGGIDALLDASGLLGVADQSVGSFSRGMRQRLAIARARVHDPALLVLDEPFSALDRSSASALESTLAALRDQGKAVFFSSHDLERVASLADRTSLLKGGTLHEQSGASHDVAALEASLGGNAG